MNLKTYRTRLLWTTFFLFLTWYYFSLPEKLFDKPYSTVITDRLGRILSVRLAADQQWRFPVADSLPDKFVQALIAFEDKRFWHHPGIDPIAFGRATIQNLKNGKIISGGSTLSMQVIRLSKNKSRNIWNKFIELIMATRLELRYTKKEILQLYASHAPFGGNMIGIYAACYRYFGRNPSELSWAEAAMLAVLPNNPSLIHLGKNREFLRKKRNRLLEKLYQQQIIDKETLTLAVEEPLPDKPVAFPNQAPHLISTLENSGKDGQFIISTLDGHLQQNVVDVLGRHSDRLYANNVFNCAALVADVRSGNVLAYVGNLPSGVEHQESVNLIIASRSTGSILKPFLYAGMIENGKMLPRTLIPDIPTELHGFIPKNFNGKYDGAVHADQALIRSLNIPAIFELREFRYEKFYTLLKNLGMTSLEKPASHYGLTLILGGAEGSLWDITGMYASLGRVLNNYFTRPGGLKYSGTDIHPLKITMGKEQTEILESNSFLGAASIWSTFQTMKELYRPGEESGWRTFSSSKTIAWKTGTSLGHRDAWAVGINPEYVVGVWVGNADGEGRPGLTGTEAAAPIMLDLFSLLPGYQWFGKPNSELIKIPVCNKSGMRISSFCTEIDTVDIPLPGLATTACLFHKSVNLTRDLKFRVNTNCASVSGIVQKNWFVLPPVQEYYFRKGFTYQPLPPYKNGCMDTNLVPLMEVVYPKPDSKIFIPVELDGSFGKAIFEVAHRNSSSIVYWHLDGNYLGQTRGVHQFLVRPGKGKHILTVVDDAGGQLEGNFMIISEGYSNQKSKTF